MVFIQMKNFYCLNSNSGFTLVETFVAITILAFSLVAPISIAASSIASVRYARDQITAFYLAGEALEYVRNVRDRNNQAGLNSPETWLSNLSICQNIDGCSVDSITDEILPANFCGSAACPLSFSGGVYGYDSTAPQSPFTRIVKLTSPTSLEEAVVDVMVSWQTKGLPDRTIVIREILWNWGI